MLLPGATGGRNRMQTPSVSAVRHTRWTTGRYMPDLQSSVSLLLTSLRQIFPSCQEFVYTQRNVSSWHCNGSENRQPARTCPPMCLLSILQCLVHPTITLCFTMGWTICPRLMDPMALPLRNFVRNSSLVKMIHFEIIPSN